MSICCTLNFWLNILGGNIFGKFLKSYPDVIVICYALTFNPPVAIPQKSRKSKIVLMF